MDKHPYLHSAPRGRDWVHAEDIHREASLLGVELRLLDYADLGLVERAEVVGGRGYYVRVDGFDFAMEAGPEEMRKLFDALEKGALAAAALREWKAGVGSGGEED